MRGSPIGQTFLLLVLLVAFGWIFTRVTGTTKPFTAALKPVPEKERKLVSVPYRLVFSSPAQETYLSSASAADGTTISIDADNPVVFLKAVWSAAPIEGETRFAKLTMEWPGRETITHVFDAPGDIDDVFEIPAEHDHD